MRDEGLMTVSGVSHAFLGRAGGVSSGIYESLNCGLGSRDDRAAVIENRRRACLAVGADGLATAYQVHSAVAVGVEGVSERLEADGLATDRPGLALGILTADCAPVLFADPEAGVVGAAHAGWRGALDGILEATVEQMVRLGADPAGTVAAVGPCIAQESYEVGEDFRMRFEAADSGNARWFVPGRHARAQFDLAGYVAARLAATGVAVRTAMVDTYRDGNGYFSYRRACHRGEGDFGRQLSVIALEG